MVCCDWVSISGDVWILEGKQLLPPDWSGSGVSASDDGDYVLYVCVSGMEVG